MKTKALILLCLSLAGCKSSEVFVKGLIIDRDSKFPIPEATISFDNEKRIGDLEGNFSVRIHKKEMIKISATGYFTAAQKMSLKKDTIFITFELVPGTYHTSQIVWEGGYATIIDKNGNLRCVPIPKKD